MFDFSDIRGLFGVNIELCAPRYEFYGEQTGDLTLGSLIVV